MTEGEVVENTETEVVEKTESEDVEKKTLWLSIEENFLELESQDLSGQNLETAIQQIAGELDNTGYNVSRIIKFTRNLLNRGL